MGNGNPGPAGVCSGLQEILMRRIGLGFVLAGLAFAAAAQIPEKVDPGTIPNYRVLMPGLATGGQPTPEGLRSLKEIH